MSASRYRVGIASRPLLSSCNGLTPRNIKSRSFPSLSTKFHYFPPTHTIVIHGEECQGICRNLGRQKPSRQKLSAHVRGRTGQQLKRPRELRKVGVFLADVLARRRAKTCNWKLILK